MTLREKAIQKIKDLDIKVSCSKDDEGKISFPTDKLLERSQKYNEKILAVYEYIVNPDGVVARSNVGYPNGKRKRKGDYYNTRYRSGLLYSTGWEEEGDFINIMLEELERLPFGYFQDEPDFCHKCNRVLNEKERGIYRGWDFGYPVRLCTDCMETYDEAVRKILKQRWENISKKDGPMLEVHAGKDPGTPIPEWAHD